MGRYLVGGMPKKNWAHPTTVAGVLFDGNWFSCNFCVFLMSLFQKLINSHDPMTPIATAAIIPGLPKSLALKHVPWKSRRCWEGCKSRASIGKPSPPKNYCLPSCLKEATLVRQAWGHRDLSRGGKPIVISVLNTLDNPWGFQKDTIIASEPPWKTSSTSSWLNNYVKFGHISVK